MQGEASTRLGFTDYFRVELAWAKLLGAVLLLAPVPARLKEWAYAAFRITLGSALIAHLSIGEGPRRRGAGRRAPGVLWGLSYFCGVASRARASAGPLEDEQRVANQDPKNPAQMKASTGSPLTDVSAEYRFHVDDGRSVQSFEKLASRRAIFYGDAGRLDDAFDCLDQAIASRDPALVYLAVAPQFDSMRGEARFPDRLKQMALPALT